MERKRRSSVTSKGVVVDLDAALEKFRAAFLEGAKQSGLEPGDLVIWGVDLLGENEVAKNNILEKFLRARDYKEDDCLKMLIETLKWRKEFDVASLMTESFPKDYDKLGFIQDVDIAGCPVTYCFYGTLEPKKIFEVGPNGRSGLQQFIRWRVRLMEQAIQRLDFVNGPMTVSQVHDYSGASMMRMDAQMKEASKQIIALFQNYYPEFLQRKLFLNVPKVMEVLYSGFSVFVAKRTRDKFQMVAEGNSRAAMFAFIDPVSVPFSLGGLAADPHSESGLVATPKEQWKGSAQLESRKSTAIKLDVHASGPSTIILIVTTEYYDISVGAEMEGGESTKPERGETVRQVLTSQGPGILTINLDNTYSQFRSKSVYYRAQAF